jgi:quercetin dioxygenase-like cupin family protein
MGKIICTSESISRDMPSVPELIQLGQIVIRFLVEGSASGGSVAMFEFEVGPGAKVPIAHSHDLYEETLYGLEGILTMTVGGHRHEIGPGEVLCIPRGAVHRFDNFGATRSRTLAVITPGVLGPAYFREIAEVARAAAAGPPDPAAIADVMRRHGLTPAPEA